MKAVKEYFSQNRKLYAWVLFFWISGAFCGAFCTALAREAQIQAVGDYISSALGQKTSFWQTVINGATENIKFTLCLLITSHLHAYFIPLTLAIVSFKGFASCLTASLFIKLYAWKGALMGFVALVIPLSLALPAYLVMFVCALRYPLDRYNAIKRGKILPKSRQRSNLWTLLIMCGYLCTVTIGEALFSCLVRYIF